MDQTRWGLWLPQISMIFHCIKFICSSHHMWPVNPGLFMVYTWWPQHAEQFPWTVSCLYKSDRPTGASCCDSGHNTLPAPELVTISHRVASPMVRQTPSSHTASPSSKWVSPLESFPLCIPLKIHSGLWQAYSITQVFLSKWERHFWFLVLFCFVFSFLFALLLLFL